MTEQDAQAIVGRVLAVHGCQAGSTTPPATLYGIATELRREFEAAGATWPELGHFAVQMLDTLGRDPGLSPEQFAAARSAFCDGFHIDVVVHDVSGDRLTAKYTVTERPRH